jgi:hypothetical protein
VTSLENPSESTPATVGSSRNLREPASTEGEVRVVVPGTVHVIRGLEPDDVLVVQLNRRISMEQAETIVAHFATVIPNRVLLIPPEMTVVSHE